MLSDVLLTFKDNLNTHLTVDAETEKIEEEKKCQDVPPRIIHGRKRFGVN